MATQRKVEFQGSFNIQEILSAVDALQNRLGKIQLDDSSVRRFEKTFSDLRKRAQEIDAEIKQGFTNPSQINTFNGHLQKLGQQMEILRGEIGRIDTSFDNLQLSPNLQKQFENLKNSANTMFDAYESQIANIESKISSFAEKSNISFGSEEISGLAQAISSEEELARLRQDKQASLQQEKGLRESNLASLKEELDISAKISKEQDAKYTELSKQIIEQQQRVSQVKNTDTEAEESSKLANLRAQRKAIKSELDKQISAQTSLVEKIKKEEKELNDVESSLSNIQKFFQALSGDSSGLDNDAAAAAKEFASLNTKVAQLEKELNQANAELQKFKDLQTQKTKTGLEKSIDDVDRLKTGLDKASDSTKDMSDSLASLNKQDEFFNNLKNRATAVFGLTNVFIYMNRFIRKSVDAIKELDAAFTEIAVVTNMTTSQLWESFDTYNEMAQKLGTTTVDAIQTSALYYQQGLDTVEVMQLTEETMKMARIAGMDYAEATDRMTAALRGFKLEMSEASRVNDVFSALAAESAVDTDELSYALTKTASIAQSAGMELETTSAFLSQMIETTREAPENIGTAMKTIIARFQELKSAVGDSVEIDGELVDVNKVDTALKIVGVQLRDSLTGQFRDLDDVFLELASKWDTLDRNTQRYVATIAAGSRQQSRFIAMMDNYERTLELVDIAQNSNGASAAQFAKTLDSLEAKMNNIQSSFEEFIGTVVGSEFVKDLLDGANTVLQMINNIAEKGPVAIGVFGTFFIVMIKKIISNTIASAKIVTSAFSSGWQKVTGNYTASMKKANQDSVKSLEDAIRNSNIAQVLATQIERGIRTGAAAGLNGTSAQVTGTAAGGSHAKAPILAQPGQKFNQKYRNQIVARLESGQSISQEDRKFLKENNINLGKNNQELLQNVKNYKSVNSALSKFGPALTQVGSTLASFGTMYIMGDAATKGTAALTGATTGSMVGSLVGTLGYAIPGAGMVLGPLFSALGGTLGAFIGEGIGEGLDKSKYGIGSEASIKKFKENASKVAEETSKVVEESENIVTLGEEYISLSEKINLTNEEKARLTELNDLLISQWDGLEYVNTTEGEIRQLNIERLKEEIKLKKQLIAENNAMSNFASAQSNITELSRAQTDIEDSARSSFLEGLKFISVNTVEEGKDLQQNLTSALKAFENTENINLGIDLTGKTNFQSSELQNYVDKLLKDLSARGRLEVNEAPIKDLLINTLGVDAGLVNEGFKEYIAAINEGKNALENALSNLDEDISSILDAEFTNISKDSFAAKNKSHLGELLKIDNLFPDLKPEEIAETDYSEIYNKRVLEAEDFIKKLNAFNSKEQQVFSDALSMIGLFDKEQIISMIEDSLGKETSNAVKASFSKVYDAEEESLSKSWANLIGTNQKYIDELANSFEKGGELIATKFAGTVMKMGQNIPVYMQSFYNEYTKILDKFTNYTKDAEGNITNRQFKNNEAKEAFSEISKAIGEVDVNSSASIAKLRIKLRELEQDESEIYTLTNSLGSVFDRSGLTAEEAIEGIEAQLENVNDLISIIGANIDGTISYQQLQKINSILKDMGKNILSNSQISATGEGFKITGDVEGIVNSGTEGTRQMLIEQAKDATMASMYLKEEAQRAFDTGNLELYNQKLEESNKYAEGAQYLLAGEADIRARTLKASIEEKDAEKERLYNLIQKYKDLIAEMNRYYNLQRTILQLQNTQNTLKLDFELANGSQDMTEIAKNQIFNLAEQQAALAQAKDIYDRDLKELGKFVNDKYGKYLTVDSSGNVFQNTDALVGLAKQLEGASESEAEQLQKLWDEIEEVRGAYEDLYDSAISSADEYKKNLIEQQKLESQLRQYQIDLEKTLRDMIIKEMQDEVKAVQDKYNKIKQEDQKYLASLQKNINKRKQMQSDQDQDKEISTLQNRIGLLQRDTSGIYTKELENLQAELDQLLQEKSNTTLERLYEEEEAKTQKVSDELILRSEYLQSQLDYELETYAISNEKVAELLKLKDEEILNWMKQHSEDFRKATTTEQENFIITWEKQIGQGKIAQKALTDDVEIQKQAIIEKFGEIKTGGIDVYISAIQKASNTPLVVKTDTSQLDIALAKLDILDTAYDDFRKKQARADLDSLLKQVQAAAAANNQDLVNDLSTQYRGALNAYKNSYGGKGSDLNMAGIGDSKGNAYSYDAALKQAISLGNKEFSSNPDNKEEYITNLPKGTKVEIKATKNGKAPLYNLDGSYAKDYNDPVGYDVDTQTSGEAKKINGTWMVQTVETAPLFIPLSELQVPGGWGSGEKWNSKARVATRIKGSAYATGGMVDYTGPAWVDGTKTKPEAFLSAADTANIAKLRDILSKVFDSPKSSSNDSPQNQNSGDTYYEFHITVDELGEGYDAKDMMADMEKYIIQKSNYRNVINIGKRK